ncbi:MAG: hypothetical protein WCT14_11885 [Treponemataceae bacterium]
MMNSRLGSYFENALPQYNNWIIETKNKYATVSQSINHEDFFFVNSRFPKEIIRDVRIVIAQDFPYPPFDKMGLSDLAYWKQVKLQGITYGNLIFINTIEEPLVFHELVHVCQKYFIGYDKYHLAYAQYVISNGYDENPFEETAYRLEEKFMNKTLEVDFIEIIKQEAMESFIRIDSSLI